MREYLEKRIEREERARRESQKREPEERARREREKREREREEKMREKVKRNKVLIMKLDRPSLSAKPTSNAARQINSMPTKWAMS